MSAELLQMISIGAFIFSGILFISGGILYFKLNIKAVVDDLSGKSAELQIRKLREENMHSVEYQSSRDLFETVDKDVTAKLHVASEAEEGTQLLMEQRATGAEQEEGTVLLLEEPVCMPSGYKIVRSDIEVHTEETI